MKKLFLLIAVFLLTGLNAQNLKDFSIPKGYKKVAEARGDLDKDGKDEVVIVCNTNEITADTNSQEKDYKRVFYILKNENGRLTIWKENSTFLFSSGTGFYPSDNTLVLNIKNNCLSGHWAGVLYQFQTYTNLQAHFQISEWGFLSDRLV